MGLSWYSVKTASSSRAAVLVFNKYVKKVIDPGYVDPRPESFFAPLEEKEKKWLLKQADGFRLYDIGESFVLAMQKDYDMVTPPILEVCGPDEIDDKYIRVQMDSILVPEDDQYQTLLEFARKLTPVSEKVVFPPARYHFVAPLAYQLPVCEISLEENDKKPNERTQQEIIPPANVPLDFKLVVGEGDAKKSFKLNKAVLACYFPQLESLIGDLSKTGHIELPDLEVDAVDYVIRAYSTRSEVEELLWESELQDVEVVQEKFGLIKGRKRSKTMRGIHADVTLPVVLTDPRWLDVTFVVGPMKEELKANRAVLASRNHVLAHTLYGTESNPVDTDQPIDWPQFDNAEAVRKVFLALIRCGEAETRVPQELVKSVKAVVDYLAESRESLNLYYETPFERKFEGSFLLEFEDVYEEDDEYGLVLHEEEDK